MKNINPIFKAMITMDDVNGATDHGISGTTDVMTALKGISGNIF